MENVQEEHGGDLRRCHEARDREEEQKEVDDRTPVEDRGKVLEHDLNLEAQVQELEVLLRVLCLRQLQVLLVVNRQVDLGSVRHAHALALAPLEAGGIVRLPHLALGLLDHLGSSVEVLLLH